MKELSKEDCVSIIIGGTLLGTGGGADPVKGMKLIEPLKKVKLLKLNELKDEDLVFCTFMVGSSGAKETNLEIACAAKRDFFNFFNSDFNAIIPVELGGGALGESLAMAATLNLPLVDADIVGYRAAPEIFLETITLKNLSRTPLVVRSEKGSMAILVDSSDSNFTEKFLRDFAINSGGVAYVCGYPLKIKDIKDIVGNDSISFCLKVGKAIQEKTFTPNLKEFGFVKLDEGVISQVELLNYNGFLQGFYEVKSKKDIYRVLVKNENILCKKNNRTLVTTPDSICILNAEKEEPVYNRDIQPGMKVLILLRKAIPIWLSKQGIYLFEPRNIGFTERYVDFEKELAGENFNKDKGNMEEY